MKELSRENPKKMWELIDWSNKDKGSKEDIPPLIIEKFFRKIFQSETTMNHPKIQEAEEQITRYVNENEVTDNDISEEEVKTASLKMKRGVGIDGIAPTVVSIFPPSLFKVIQKLFQECFGNYYPEAWTSQLLLSFEKKGHSIINPNLRGIGIGPLLSRLYDIVMDNRFKQWYKPNIEQAGFRELQGCILQIFALLLLIDLAHKSGKDLLIGIIDYEKAFDYVNRYLMVTKMIEEGVGKRYITSFFLSYEKTNYIIKASADKIGNTIETNSGVTQGKTSSSNVFSFFVSDMHKPLESLENCDYMDPMNLLQLADDTTVLAETTPSFHNKMKTVQTYSEDKDMSIHPSKSKYLHLTNNVPLTNDIIIDGKMRMQPIDEKGYNWLGFGLSKFNSVSEILRFHFKMKMVHVSSFYSWLDVNRDTPIKIKLQVLYGCMFQAILYSSEAWGDIDFISDDLRKMEKKALKSCLGVKLSTPDDIVYQELDIPDIVSVIKERQLNFMKNFMQLGEDSAVAKKIWKLYCDEMSRLGCSSFTDYYCTLQDDEKVRNMSERKIRLQNATQSMATRYRELTKLQHCNSLYSTFLMERHRIIITRWRLSCHQLKIETARYKKPKPPREERKCSICHVMEDESHALFVCRAHEWVRFQHRETLEKYTNVTDILNPKSVEDANAVAKYLKEIEDNMVKLNMVK